MKEITGNLWRQPQADLICITTNGYATRAGKAVMGRGCAKQAANKYPEIPKFLGSKHGRHLLRVTLIPKEMTGEHTIASFLVKPRTFAPNDDRSNVVGHLRHRKDLIYGNFAPGWASVASPRIIERSAHQLVSLVERHGFQRIVLPRPGCGAGELQWEEVKKILSPILDDRFSVITYNSKPRTKRTITL